MSTTIEVTGRVHFKGMRGGKNASAIALDADRAYVVADEMVADGNLVQVFKADGDDFAALPDSAMRLDAPGAQPAEMDLEGLALGNGSVFVLGSHSGRRRKVAPDRPYAQNRDALLTKAEPQPARDALLRVAMDTGEVARTSLRALF